MEGVLFRGKRVDKLTTNDLVKMGVCQVMEGRHCFQHLTVEENLLTGAFTRKGSRAEIAVALEKVYHYFPRLKTRRSSQASGACVRYRAKRTGRRSSSVS